MGIIANTVCIHGQKNSLYDLNCLSLAVWIEEEAARKLCESDKHIVWRGLVDPEVALLQANRDCCDHTLAIEESLAVLKVLEPSSLAIEGVLKEPLRVGKQQRLVLELSVPVVARPPLLKLLGTATTRNCQLNSFEGADLRHVTL